MPSPNATVEKIHKQFEHYLIGKNYILGDAFLNDGLELELLEKEEAAEQPKTGWTQRVLLDVEKQRVEKELAAKAKRQKQQQVVANYFNQRLVKDILLQLSDSQGVLTHLLRLPQNTVDLLLALSLPYPRLSSLATLIEQTPEIKRRLFFLVSSHDFMNLLGRKPRVVKDTQAAVGLLGVELLKQMVPAMIFKYRIRLYNSVSPGFGKKLWRHLLTSGLSTSFLLQQSGYKRPAEGLILAGLKFLGHMACLQQFQRSFDETMVECLNEARQKGDKRFHDLLFDVEADAKILEKLLSEQALEFSLDLAKTAFSEQAPQLVQAIREELSDTRFEQRGVLGKALYSGIRFSMFEQLRVAKLLQQEDVSPWRQYCHLEMADFKSMHQQDMSRINYAQFK
ncbi:HDOD domain-containing protein [Motilimonas pumila]|uniref:HDOD domain-containing protein n=1 Tax=Motilimonas pumila TaxID=2303987 RepID=A0A418YIW5_9GAMM|nr:HDOD domain-containing protein [Motilimonas pumila]RJG50557.1 HDOD domain-containing protein [Motilimonas pumila]